MGIRVRIPFRAQRDKVLKYRFMDNRTETQCVRGSLRASI